MFENVKIWIFQCWSLFFLLISCFFFDTLEQLGGVTRGKTGYDWLKFGFWPKKREEKSIKTFPQSSVPSWDWVTLWLSRAECTESPWNCCYLPKSWIFQPSSIPLFGAGWGGAPPLTHKHGKRRISVRNVPIFMLLVFFPWCFYLKSIVFESEITDSFSMEAEWRWKSAFPLYFDLGSGCWLSKRNVS